MPENTLPQLPQTISFASELIKGRSELNLTQSQLAERSGLSLSAIKAYESGRNMPGARELRELCQALQVSPNKLLFGTELPFKERTLANLLVDSAPESEHVAQARVMVLLSLLSLDEQEAVMTLVRSLAIARHGVEKAKNLLLSADFVVGLGRELGRYTRDGVNAGQPFEPGSIATRLEEFLERQGHQPDSEKLPKK